MFGESLVPGRAAISFGLIYVTYMGLEEDFFKASIGGAVFGYCLHAFTPLPFGTLILTYALTGFWTALISEKLERSSFLTQWLVTASAMIVALICRGLLWIVSGTLPPFQASVNALVVTGLLTVLFSPLFISMAGAIKVKVTRMLGRDELRRHAIKNRW